MTFWTEERTTLLRDLWAQGMPPSHIANELGCTSNAALGKVHRIGLPMRRLTSGPRKPKTSTRKRPKAQPRDFVPPPIERIHVDRTPVQISFQPENKDHLIPLDQRKTLFELTPTSCRWPVGEPGYDDFFFCGAEANNAIYCDHHMRRATAPRRS